MNLRWSRWSTLPIVIALAVAAVVAAPSMAGPLLRAAGWALVVNEPVAPADIIVIAGDSAGAGVLQAADLVHDGIAARVAVFQDPPRGEDLEFIRRGLPYEDDAAVQIRQLGSLGITDVEMISRDEAGSDGEGQVLPAWSDRNAIRSMVFVAARDHSRRLKRVLDRAMKGHAVRVMVQAERYSGLTRSIGGRRAAVPGPRLSSLRSSSSISLCILFPPDPRAPRTGPHRCVALPGSSGDWTRPTAPRWSG